MLKPLLILSLIATPVLAASPATRPAPPTTPVGPREQAAVLDTSKPAFVPKFVQTSRVPAGQFEEREYVRRYGSPAGFGYGAGSWGACGWWGYGFVGGHGPASANISVNYR